MTDLIIGSPECPRPVAACDVWLVDVSGSMTGRRREILERDLAVYIDNARRVGVTPRLIAFASTLYELGAPDLRLLPPSGGGTALHLALARAAELSAANVVIFSDGEPSVEDLCFRAVRDVPGTISVVFCGDIEDSGGMAFCNRLARLGGGESVSRDLARGQSLICSEVRDMLGLPAPPRAV